MSDRIKIQLRYFLYFTLYCNSIIAQENKMVLKSFPKIRSDVRVNNISIQDDNILWLATSQGIIKTDIAGTSVKSFKENVEVIDIIFDKSKDVWAAGTNFIYHLATDQSYDIGENNLRIKDIAYHNGNIWIASDNGLYKFNTNSKKYIVYNNKNSKLASNKVNFVHVDSYQIIWIGTDNGYIRMEKDKWEIQDKDLKMLATYENHEGQWIMTDKDMFLINKYNRLFPADLRKNQYKGIINQFVIDQKGSIYIASDLLVKYDPYNDKTENISDVASLVSKVTLSLACDVNNALWVGTDGSGFYTMSTIEKAGSELTSTCIVSRPIQCHGAADGSLIVSANGGKPPYTYSWNNGETKSENSFLSAGIYTVSVVDSLGKESISTYNLSGPNPLQLITNVIKNITNPDEADGSISVGASGGSGAIVFKWSNNKTQSNISGLSSGQYTVTITDKNGCKATNTYTIKREKYIPDLEISKVSLGQKLRINELNFIADSSNITSENFEILEEVYEFMNQNPTVSVEIGGHTNTIPSHEYCDLLSESRAKNVAQYLVNRGIEKARILYKGYGKREPLTDSTSLQGRTKNQRVEIKILKL